MKEYFLPIKPFKANTGGSGSGSGGNLPKTYTIETVEKTEIGDMANVTIERTEGKREGRIVKVTIIPKNK